MIYTFKKEYSISLMEENFLLSFVGTSLLEYAYLERNIDSLQMTNEKIKFRQSKKMYKMFNVKVQSTIL